MFSEGFTKKFRSFFSRRRRNQSGQAMIEYIILLTIVIGVVSYFLGKMTGGFDSTTARYGGRIEQQLRTGSAPPTIWNK